MEKKRVQTKKKIPALLASVLAVLMLIVLVSTSMGGEMAALADAADGLISSLQAQPQLNRPSAGAQTIGDSTGGYVTISPRTITPMSGVAANLDDGAALASSVAEALGGYTMNLTFNFAAHKTNVGGTGSTYTGEITIASGLEYTDNPLPGVAWNGTGWTVTLSTLQAAYPNIASLTMPTPTAVSGHSGVYVRSGKILITFSPPSHNQVPGAANPLDPPTSTPTNANSLQ